MSDVVYDLPLVTTLPAAVPFAHLLLNTFHSTQMGFGSALMYFSVSWLYSAAVPPTVASLLSDSFDGAMRVHRMTLSGQGSPEATPCVKLSSEGWWATLPRFMDRRSTRATSMPRLAWRRDGLP